MIEKATSARSRLRLKRHVNVAGAASVEDEPGGERGRQERAERSMKVRMRLRLARHRDFRATNRPPGARSDDGASYSGAISAMSISALLQRAASKVPSASAIGP